MPAHQRYYPIKQGDQIIWLQNWRSKLPQHAAALGLTQAEITTTTVDASHVLYILEKRLPATDAFAQATTAAAKLLQLGPDTGLNFIYPGFNLLDSPPGDPVRPGALSRIFTLVASIKLRGACTTAVCEDLQIVGPEAVEDPNAPPDVTSLEAVGSEIILRFRKKGRMGVYIESKVAADPDWTFLAIDTSSPYNDTRPLRIAGQPEKRYYRLCLWDGTPTHIWTPIHEITFGG